MDLELLRTFLEVERTRHFGRSAVALHLTQAAVSQRIRTLETALGTRLFERSTRSIRLTPAGRRLIPHAERQMAAWRIARQDVSVRAARAQLAIGGSLRLWNALLQPWLHLLRRRHPEMAIIAESLTPELLTRGLIEGTLDVAVMLEPAQLEMLCIEEVATIELILVSDQRGLAVDEALDDRYVYVDWGLAHGLEHRGMFPGAAEAMTRVSQAKMALEYITAVGGSAYLPRGMAADGIAAGRLHIVADAPVFKRRAYAAYPLRSAHRELVEACISLLGAAD